MELNKKQELAVAELFDDISDNQLKEDLQAMQSLLDERKLSKEILFINELLLHEANRRGWIL